MMHVACRYEASQMHWKNGMAQGFALFSHGAAAGQAIQTINGLVFDDGVVSQPADSVHIYIDRACLAREVHHTSKTARGSIVVQMTLADFVLITPSHHSRAEISPWAFYFGARMD